ncbi:MAG: hypothetical protein AAFR73_07040 [Pseudomonadota bacterium]
MDDSSDSERDQLADETEKTVAESSDDASGVIEGEAYEVAEADEQVTSSDADLPGEPETPEPVTASVAEEPAASNTGTPVLALIFGGIVAGAIGYFGASLAPVPESQIDTTELSSDISANADAVTALVGEVETLKAMPAAEQVDYSVDLSALTTANEALLADLSAVRSEFASSYEALEAQLQTLDGRILALETAVPAASGLEVDDELAALRERISDMTAEAQTQLAAAQAEAASVAKAAEEARLAAEAEAEELRSAAEARETELQAMAERQEALIDLKAAAEVGAPYIDFLDELDDVSEVVAASAESGLTSVQALQTSFPPLARTALAKSVSIPEDATAGKRISAFLKRRTNARSLTPQDGDSADAILSRAEAALEAGSVTDALGELSALPEDSRSALQVWIDQAETRIAVLDAIDQMSATN